MVGDSLKNVMPRQVGAEAVCLEALRRLKLGVFLRSKGWDKEHVNLALIQIAARAIYPCSEHRTLSYLRENPALCEFFGVDPKRVTKDRLYKSALDLYSLHDSMEDYLHGRVCDKFGLDDTVYLFDLTNAYMESTRLSKHRQFGHSKEKRSDRPVVVLGAVANKDGLLVRTMVFSGNTADCTTTQDMMGSLNPPSSEGKKKIVVMDAGISIEANLEWLRQNGYDYITVHRGGSTDRYKVRGDCTVTVEKPVWEYYNAMRRVEAVFETLKADLDVRPVYHQNDEVIKAHFYLAVLAYWVVSITQYQLRQKGSRISWRELMRIASTQVVASTIAKRVDGQQVEKGNARS